MEGNYVAANADLSTPYVNSLEETSANCLNSNDPKCLLKGNPEESESEKSGTCNFKDDDLLISVILKNKSYKSKCKHLRNRKSKFSIRSPNRGVAYLSKKKEFSEQRTVLSWLIYAGALSLGEVIQYRSQKNDVVEEGIITQKGILCRCCEEVMSISEFKSHTGFRLNSPYLNLYMSSGKPFSSCLLEAWCVEYKARKSGATQAVQIESMHNHDDNCGRCGDQGNLICCDNCTSAFHQACLNLKELPKGNWYCPQCTCRFCGQGVNSKEAMSSPGTQCRQCENRYHEACKQQSLRSDVASDTWCCSASCQEVYLGLQAQIGLTNQFSDGLSWALLKCIDGNLKAHSSSRFLTLKAACNSKLAIALTIMEECFSQMLDPTTGVDIIPQMVYNLGSKYPRVNYSGFYTAVLEKDDEVVTLASIRIHGVKVAEIPFVATRSKYRSKRMCHLLFSAIENMLRSLSVEKLVISAIPSTVEFWKKSFGFEVLEDAERLSLRNINLMAVPGSEYLKKPLFVR